VVANFELEMIDDDLFPNRELRLYLSSEGLTNHSAIQDVLVRLKADTRLYFSTKGHRPLTFGYRIGGATNLGDYQFFQSNMLSGTENLRGFNRNRFAGRSAIYQNIDLRWKLANFKTYLFPGKLGLITFWDAGKVAIDDETSRKIHHGFGGGVWAYIFKTLIVNINYAKSQDNGLFIAHTKLFF